jgi:hypothetical protein
LEFKSYINYYEGTMELSSSARKNTPGKILRPRPRVRTHNRTKNYSKFHEIALPINNDYFFGAESESDVQEVTTSGNGTTTSSGVRTADASHFIVAAAAAAALIVIQCCI